MICRIKSFFTGNYNLLLILLFLLFVFRPYTGDEVYIETWKSFLIISLIVAIFNCSHKRSTKIFISILAIPTFILSWLNLLDQTFVTLTTTAVFTAIYMGICAGTIVVDVVIRARVTLETLRGVICAYFLVAFVFAYIYLFLEYFFPGSFLIRGEELPIYPHMRYLSNMLYFSFVSLLAIGFGDVIPVKEWSQTAVVIEGFLGQMYIAILVSRLVSIYTLMTDRRLIKEIDHRHK